MALTACSQPDTGGNIRFGLSSSPVSLDPRLATDAASYRINRLLYASLVDFNASLQAIPSLARWTQIDPTHYRFILQADRASFTDGTPLTAADVKATYESVLDPALASPHRGDLRHIQQIQIENDSQLLFSLDAPDVLFPGKLTLGILPARAIAGGQSFTKQALGSGAFEQTRPLLQGQLTIRRRSDQQLFVLSTVKDATLRALKLVRGELHLAQNDFAPELFQYLKKQPQLILQQSQGSNFTYLGFNLADPLTGRHEIRQAIAHAIDRSAIIRYLMGGRAHTASALLPPDHWAGAPDLPAIHYDPEQSRSLLRAAGFDASHPLQLSYKTSTDPLRVRIATVIQQQLSEVGIQVTVQSYDWGTFFGDIKKGHFQMYSLSWVGIKSPDIYRYVFHSAMMPPKGANRGRYHNPQADALIEQAERQPELARQAFYYRQLQALLLQDLPYVPLWYEDHVLVHHRLLLGSHVARDGNYDFLKTIHWSSP